MSCKTNKRKKLTGSIDENEKKHFLKAFGENIRAFRQDRNLSQEEFALICQTNTRKIGRTERGELDFKVSSLIILANGLKLHPYELLIFGNKSDVGLMDNESGLKSPDRIIIKPR